VQTLGMLVDQLATVRLKQWHTTDAERLAILEVQRQRLMVEIDALFAKRNDPDTVLSAPSCKVYTP
jgi:hypothetical protein